MDVIDQQIVEILQIEGRITNSELAKRVGLSAGPCLERVKKLEKNGVIIGYHAQVNPEKIGIGMFSFVEVTLARHKHDAVVSFVSTIKSIPEIINCYHITGRADYLLEIATKDIADYEKFVIDVLSTLPGVQHLETMVVLSGVKTKKSLPSF